VGRLALGLDSSEAGKAQIAGGLRVGAYELGAELGRGGMGVVYRARQAGLGREVALKLILAGEFAGEAERRRFLAEAEAAAQLDHPNIVPIYEAGEHGGRHYYAMKLIEGRSLASELAEMSARGKKFPAKDAARLLAALARAVRHAHERGFLHRDLKPANVMLDSAGEPHITDFGLARRMDLDPGRALTQGTGVVGTPAYMAPEMAGGEKNPTVAADVWSLGAILYELLAGRPAFDGTSMAQIFDQIRGQEPAAPASVRPEVPRDLETICLKCLRKEPAQRYGSAAALAEDLERWLRGEPVQARPIAPVERLCLWAKRRPLVAGLSLALVLGAAAGSLMLWQANRRLASSLEATRKAELEAKRNLHTALLAQLRARRGAGAAPSHADTLKVVAEAAKLAPTLETRNEAAIALAARDEARGGRGGVYEIFDPPPFAVKQSCTVDASPDGRWVLAGTQEGLVMWEARTGRVVWSLAQTGLPWMTAFFSADGKHLLCSARNFGIQRRALTVSESGGAAKVEFGPPETVGRSFDSTLQMPVGGGGRDWLVALDRNPLYIVRAEVWPEGDPARARRAAAGETMTWLHASAEGNWAASVTLPPTGVRIWREGALERTLNTGDLSGALGAAFAPDSRRLITRDAKLYRVWETETWQELASWPAESTGLAGRIKFSSAGEAALVSQGIDRVQARRLSDYGELFTLTPPKPVDVFDFVLSRDGRQILLLAAGGRVHAWNLDRLAAELALLGLQHPAVR